MIVQYTCLKCGYTEDRESNLVLLCPTCDETMTSAAQDLYVVDWTFKQ